MVGQILIVDDSETSRQHVMRALQSLPVEFVQAENGEDALKKMAGLLALRLVVTDLNMPWKDGLEMIEDMANAAEFKHIPVLIVTAEASPDQLQRAKLLGIRGWLIKPFKPDMLLTVVQKLLQAAAA